MASLIGGEALIPNPALRPLGRVIGEWETSGTHPYLPGRELRGRAVFEWHLGGAFVLMRTQVDAPEIPSGVAVFGSDDGASGFFMLYFDERGVSRKYDVLISDRMLQWERLDPAFSQRSTLAFTDDADRMLGHGEMSRDGAEWEGDLSLVYTRVGGPQR